MKKELSPISKEQIEKLKSDADRYSMSFIPGELYTKAMQEEFIRYFYHEAEKLREDLADTSRTFVTSPHNRYFSGKNDVRVYTCDVTSYDDAKQKLEAVMGYQVKAKTAEEYIQDGLKVVDQEYADTWKMMVNECFKIYEQNKDAGGTIFPGDDLERALSAIEIERERGVDAAVASISPECSRAAFIASACLPNGAEFYQKFNDKHEKFMKEVEEFFGERNEFDRD